MRLNFKKLGLVLGVLLINASVAKADDVYGRFLLCDTSEFQASTGQTTHQRFFNAAMGQVNLTFTVTIDNRTIRGSGTAYDGYGTFELKDLESGESKNWSGYLASAHQVERQSFNLSLGSLFVTCQYGIPVGL